VENHLLYDGWIHDVLSLSCEMDVTCVAYDPMDTVWLGRFVPHLGTSSPMCAMYSTLFYVFE